eukprot:TRINITY_DN25691_c0_g1_i1.p1 TRINITY_DN25691_c0_g1~~TRINITY_DN25691_c0_g1_i1.p1  ORF type:complete len:204 (-),score=23.83 TRINITY_DN25691_c0_g1_i1:14-625(-)
MEEYESLLLYGNPSYDIRKNVRLRNVIDAIDKVAANYAILSALAKRLKKTGVNAARRRSTKVVPLNMHHVATHSHTELGVLLTEMEKGSGLNSPVVPRQLPLSPFFRGSNNFSASNNALRTSEETDRGSAEKLNTSAETTNQEVRLSGVTIRDPNRSQRMSVSIPRGQDNSRLSVCLLYTSEAADDRRSRRVCGRRRVAFRRR